MFWEHSPYSTNIASDWRRAESSPVDEEGRKKEKRKEKKEKRMTVSLGSSLASERIRLFVDLWEAHPCL